MLVKTILIKVKIYCFGQPVISRLNLHINDV